MRRTRIGTVIKGLGGLYEILLADAVQGECPTLTCRAKGSLRRDDGKLLVGDRVCVLTDSDTPDGVVIDRILPRQNQLIRPPMANLHRLYLTVAACAPEPSLLTVDKLLAICASRGIETAVVITKSDLNPDGAHALHALYTHAGYPVFCCGLDCEPQALRSDLHAHVRCGRIGAFAGASGVGKSTLVNRLFPDLHVETADISRKTERGRHTTRHVQLYPLVSGEDPGFLADTPGFSLLDFERFDFFSLEELPSLFPDLACFFGQCRYADCTHTGEGETECAVVRAAKQGQIASSRLASYQDIYRSLKNKKPY